MQEIAASVAKGFGLGEEELSRLLPSGRQSIFHNRIGWAKTYLKQARLLQPCRKAVFKITEQGKSVLTSAPERINISFLRRFPEFQRFEKRRKENSDSAAAEVQLATPEEQIEAAYNELRNSMAGDLLEKIRSIPPKAFEILVVDLLVKMGYGGSRTDTKQAFVTGKPGDEGIDGIIKEDKLGLDVIYIQAKRWKKGNVIGRPELQKFVGALAGQGAQKGVFITTSAFTKEAQEYKPRNDTKIILIDGMKLADLCIEYNIGVTVINTYELKKIDNDYFDES